MMRWIMGTVAAVALVMTGWVHGNWTDRWATDDLVTKAAAALDEIPMQFGEWEGKNLELKQGQAGPGVAGCVQRSYVNRRTGVSVVIALVNGRPGPVATHTPEVCYGASGYTVQQKQPVEVGDKNAPARFWTSDAVRKRVTEETRLRLYWAWNGGQGWSASTDARQEFPRSSHPVLHKLYVLRELGLDLMEGKAKDKDEPCVAFLDALLPVLDQKLFGKEG